MDEARMPATPQIGDEVAGMFDALAAEYDGWYQTPLGALVHSLEEEAIFSLAGPVGGQAVLDASCGTGVYALELARHGARVTATDVSAPMLALTQSKARRTGWAVVPVRASLEQLPFRSGSFELVTCVLALEFVAEPAAVLAELARVQTPGGRLVIGVLGRFSLWALWRRLKGWFRPSLWRHAHFFSRAEVSALMREAGYEELAEKPAIYFPPVNSPTLLSVLHRLERPGRRWLPGMATFLAVAGRLDGVDVIEGVEDGELEL